LADEIELRLRAEPGLDLAGLRPALAGLGADEATLRVAYRLARRWAAERAGGAPPG
jgi:hypothetical protein